MKGLSLLKNSLAVAPYFSDEYSGDYAQKFAIGHVMTVPLSQRYTVQRNDMTFNAQALDRPSTTINISETGTIALEWGSIEQALDMERGEERVEEIYLKPAIAYLRQEIESSAAQFAARNSSMVIGNLGTDPNTFDLTSGWALQRLVEMGCPVDDENLGLFLPPAVNRVVKTSANAFFNPQLDLSKQFRSGFVQKSDSFDWYASNSLWRHTAGVWGGAVTTATGGQSGATLNVTCTSGDTFKKGDKFSIANVNEVNLMTRIPNKTLAAGTKTFTVLADVTAAGTSAALSIYPPIYGPGSHYQNVDALPGAGAALTLWPGTTSPSGKTGKIGLALYPGAFFIAGVPLDLPDKGVEFARQYTDSKTGLSIRLIRDWDNRTSTHTTRFDLTWGFGIGLAEQCAVAIACA
jgi:hypothetical protein